MNQDYIQPNNWSIIEEGFDKDRVKSSESLFSIGNGAMGQRANFEEDYSGDTFQGSYIGGVYYPDKTRVGWWKNGYPEYFAKVLNAPNWIGIHVKVNGESLDLNTCNCVSHFRRELNMKAGYYKRNFQVTMENGIEIAVESIRLLSLDMDELGAINYKVTAINREAEITLIPYLDAGITNLDTNWDDLFWETLSVSEKNGQGFIRSRTMKTDFHVCTFMQSRFLVDEKEIGYEPKSHIKENYIGFEYATRVRKGQSVTLEKFAGYTVSTNHEIEDLINAAKNVLHKGISIGFSELLASKKKLGHRYGKWPIL